MTDPLAGAAERIFNAFVGPESNATYYPRSGGPVPCRLRLSGRNRADTAYPDVDVAAIDGFLLESEVGGDVQTGDRVEYQGTTYVISDTPRSDGYTWAVALNTRTASPL